MEALAVAAAVSGWPAFLLEKAIWVVWALQILGTDQQLLQSLTFKGGTSLSKANGLIDRFSEDVDLTLNIQRLWPEVDLAPACQSQPGRQAPQNGRQEAQAVGPGDAPAAAVAADGTD